MTRSDYYNIVCIHDNPKGERDGSTCIIQKNSKNIGSINFESPWYKEATEGKKNSSFVRRYEVEAEKMQFTVNSEAEVETKDYLIILCANGQKRAMKWNSTFTKMGFYKVDENNNISSEIIDTFDFVSPERSSFDALETMHRYLEKYGKYNSFTKKDIPEWILYWRYDVFPPELWEDPYEEDEEDEDEVTAVKKCGYRVKYWLESDNCEDDYYCSSELFSSEEEAEEYANNGLVEFYRGQDEEIYDYEIEYVEEIEYV